MTLNELKIVIQYDQFLVGVSKEREFIDEFKNTDKKKMEVYGEGVVSCIHILDNNKFAVNIDLIEGEKEEMTSKEICLMNTSNRYRHVVVYKDTVNSETDGDDNLCVLLIPENVLMEYIREDGFKSLEEWENEYTADWTTDFVERLKRNGIPLIVNSLCDGDILEAENADEACEIAMNRLSMDEINAHPLKDDGTIDMCGE